MLTELYKQIADDLAVIMKEWEESGLLHADDLFILGCSTSEAAGKQIGSAGSEDIAAIIYDSLHALQEKTKINLAFQCCEHLNRAVVMEKETMLAKQLDPVSVIPQPSAGGSMASYAYKQLKHPVVVETVQSDAGMDIGETMIGMHLKHVAVPLRFAKRHVGNARMTAAYTRPKLIGGERAVYQQQS